MPPVVPVIRTRFPATSKGALAQATYEHHPRDAHGWSLGSELLTQPSPGDRTHARHHCIKRLMDLPGVTVSDVDFQPAKVVVTGMLRGRKLFCPECGFTTKARYDTRPVFSTWRHLDLGRWRLEVRAPLRRIDCPRHGARIEGVPFA